jgi:hypothetical protein
MENQWLAHAKRLQAIASTGLHYTRDEFDRERYREIGEIANRPSIVRNSRVFR